MNANGWIPTPISDPVKGRWPTAEQNREGKILWQLKGGSWCSWSMHAVDQEAWQLMPSKYTPPASTQEETQINPIATSLFSAINDRGINPDGSRRSCGDAAIYINNLIHMALQQKGNLG